MTFTFEWVLPNHILKAELPAQFDNHVAQEYDKDVVGYLDAAESPIHLIVDLRECKVNPAMTTILNWQHLKHPKLGYTILVGLSSNLMASFSATLVRQVVGIRIKSAATIDEAVALARRLSDSSSKP